MEAAGAAPFVCDPPLQPSTHGGWDLRLNLAELAKPFDPARVFGRGGRFEVEVGIGSGYFLSRYAAEHPSTNLLGIDKAGSEVHRTADKCRRAGVLNVRVLRCDALYFLEDYAADAGVDAYHVYYSDPWPKKRHHKRRFWHPRFVAILERTLKPEGTLWLKTDVTELYDVIQGLLKPAPFLRLEEDRRLDVEPIEGDHVTNFQRKAVEQGHPLHYQVWRRA